MSDTATKDYYKDLLTNSLKDLGIAQNNYGLAYLYNNTISLFEKQAQSDYYCIILLEGRSLYQNEIAIYKVRHDPNYTERDFKTISNGSKMYMYDLDEAELIWRDYTKKPKLGNEAENKLNKVSALLTEALQIINKL